MADKQLRRLHRATATILVSIDTQKNKLRRYADRELTHEAKLELDGEATQAGLLNLIEGFRKDPVACFALHGRVETEPQPSAA